MDAFISPEPHPETLELARKLIDEIQTGGKSCSHSSKLPPVPAFQDSINIRKQSVKKKVGVSDSDPVADFDYRNVGGGDSDSFVEEGAEAEDMYSGDESSKSESGETSGSNYESTSSFESRRKKQFKRSSHGSATSKAAAAGRKKKMIANRKAALENSPQSVCYNTKQKDASDAKKRKAVPSTPDESQGSSSAETKSDTSGSGNGGSESSDGSPPPTPKKGKGKAPPK